MFIDILPIPIWRVQTRLPINRLLVTSVICEFVRNGLNISAWLGRWSLAVLKAGTEIMRKLFLYLLVTVISTVAAQAAPSATLFGGYQYTRFDGGPNANGWNAALTAGFNSWIGVRADFSAAYPTGFNFYTYTVGPELSVHLPIIRPFAHVLVGGARISAFGTSSNGFDLMVGGGVDVGHGMIAWRLAQVDWMSTRFSGVSDNKNIRVCTGLVVRF
jgi:hypothetical protein